MEMEWINVDDRLPLFTNLVMILTWELDPFLGYLDEDGMWYVNCPCCERCQIDNVKYWSDWDGMDSCGR